ncbi:MAG TPA: universal stress protein [Thiotrichaceae bacterium]|jgi:nucleotide-binding universal stress UspA family protein|nr:universal stress protein [Thiotrichaceae bacterium]HIM07949.1 universal stress protein [Gammaproteobacteria bacterium]
MSNEKAMVVACIDGSKLSEAVCDYAAWIAQRVNVPLKLHNTIDHHHETADKVNLSGSFGIDGREHLLEEMIDLEHTQGKLRIQLGKSILEAAKKRVVEDGIAEPIISLQHGSLIESLIELEDSIRVLVIGARGKIHEGQSDQIGAKLSSMIRSLHRPILVAYEEFKKPKKIMLAYDGSEAAEKAMDLVASSPLYKGLVCHLVCVGKKDSADKLLEKAAGKLGAAGDIEVVIASLEGKPEQVLCDYQEKQNIDMTIMGAFGHTRLHDLILGSFTVKMLLNTKTSLLLLR